MPPPLRVLRWASSSMKKLASILAILFAICAPALCQTSASEFWPQVNAQFNLPRQFRVTGYTGLQNSEGFPYQQIFGGANVGYQWKRITKLHIQNSDSDKEHTLVFAGGYEYLHTLSSGSPKNENRPMLQVTLSRRPWSPLLLSDRNRVEFRWVNGAYSTRYRNMFSLSYDIAVHRFHFSPYGGAEVYYDGGKGSWNEEQYAGGIEWPFRRWFNLQTYYLRQHCTTCNPVNVNAAGLNLNFFFHQPR